MKNHKNTRPMRFFWIGLFFCISWTSLRAEHFIIKAYDVQIEVSEKGYFDVIETINVTFSSKRRGIYRNIPYRYNIDGKKYNISIHDISVDDWRYKVDRNNGQVKIRIGKKSVYIEGDQQYVIRYRVHDAFFWTDDHVEFNWNVIGHSWEVPIEQAAYSIRFPDDLSLADQDFIVRTGREGSRAQQASITYGGRNLFGEITAPLKPGEGLTVAAKLPKTLIPKVSEWTSFWQENNLFALPIAVLTFFFGLWWTRGRRSRLPEWEEPVYYPPDGYSPAEMGLLIDNITNTRDIIALLPWWAEQGLIHIRNKATSDPKALNMRLEKLKELPASAPEYQHLIFNRLFEGGQVVYLNEFSDVFYKTLGTASSKVRSILKNHEIYDWSSYRIFHSGWMIAVGAVCILSGGLVLAFLGQIATGIALIIIGICIVLLQFMPPRLSEYGQEVMRKLRSFRETLKNPDHNVIRDILKEDPKYFEYVFPYAIAFGLDQKWTQKTNGLFQHAPYWYGYYGNPNTFHNTPSFNDFTTGFQPKTIQQVFTSMPASSSGSGGGFSGGGVSGGGFGGGGGGSW